MTEQEEKETMMILEFMDIDLNFQEVVDTESEFMNYRQMTLEDVDYKSWGWLMPVIEKIESLGHTVETKSLQTPGGIQVHHIRIEVIPERPWTVLKGPFKIIDISVSEKSKIELYYSAVIKFIEQYKK